MSFGNWTSGVLSMKYQSSSDTISCAEMGGYLSYYPDINLSSNDRNEQIQVIEYKYVDNKGDTIYYCVGYHIEERNDGYAFGETVPEDSNDEGCFAEGTMITMADGSEKAVEELQVGDMLMAFNHFTGKFEAAPMIFNVHADDKDAIERDVINLEFSNGKDVEIINFHGFFDMTNNEYVYIDKDNYKDYIGHEFYSIDNSGLPGTNVVLENAYVEKKITRIFAPATALHLNSVANGMLNMPNMPEGIRGLINYFEYDDNLKYNEKEMLKDINEYGLYSYNDFSEYASEEFYNATPIPFLKVAVGKGLVTEEEIISIIKYLTK